MALTAENATKTARLEMDSQLVIHRFTEREHETVETLAMQLAAVLEHPYITTADVRYAAAIVVIERTAQEKPHDV